jgi:transcriptional regulator with XRE-family HTH domain
MKLKEIRKLRKVKAADLVRQVRLKGSQLSIRALSRYENGKTGIMSVETAKAIAEILAVRIDDFA